MIAIDAEKKQLQKKYDDDVSSYKGKCVELRKQLLDKEEENLELKRKLGKSMIENKKLQDQHTKMHREFFFSMAISLASKGIYSNADLNTLYEEILFVEYKNWNKWLESRLVTCKIEDDNNNNNNNNSEKNGSVTPLGTPARRKQPPRSVKKKKLFGLF